MKHIRLNQPEMSSANKGWTDMWEITAEDLTLTTNGAPQTIVLHSLAVGDIVGDDVLLTVLEPVVGLTTATAEVGVTGSTTQFIAASNLLAAGVRHYMPAYSASHYPNVTTVKEFGLVVRGGAGEPLNAATAGRFRVWAQIGRAADLVRAQV